MAKKYDICIKRISKHRKREHFRITFHVGDLDPGWEVMLAVAAARFKDPDTETISASKYTKQSCPNAKRKKDQRIQFESRSLEKLVEAIASGDLKTIGTRAADTAASAVVSTVNEAGNILRRIGRIFG